ncbi:MAG: methionine synthase [Omnitrophica bacterium RIFCSPLOWO2_12_FULL_44_17]|uniref:Methionine synthase n=1 Tax=Candidatus Danuiimicrobium aquiferis TaxID=1801832 RepID=A0A1G1L0D7_9BACT|nr:MAG: methionine synthase [Omnitrophica bacterium RIFCSPHIGHO2_02_FULL_45_28]OGW89446.1 MAG: methionine synthase [Omnitrophica bacterium RIFCSPHIGHO2_12_FULL_44_12]OGW98339.1 MAG: methionine synthase [Omnitrophica bacterium RIFCSPLOWO2_12_FULL_44_17]OGX02897.1 MAG: methionine synthase [Omnitrophica bacterium RIFCSPLOWO2_02_FULL_44_11]
MPKQIQHPFLECLKNKVIVFDGAMGTNLQYLNLTSKDFGDKDGCNEYLMITRPDAVRSVHESFLKVGCDVIETNTFGATRLVLEEYGLADRVVEINEKAARLAKELANQYSTPDQPRFVAGSIGPGSKLPSLGHIGFDEMKADYREQICALLAGGVDLILIETCQDLLQTKIAMVAVEECFEESGKRLPLVAQVTFEVSGKMLLGTEIGAVISVLEMFPVDVIGINCATGPREMTDHIRYLCEHSVKYISVLPNAGLPENIGGRAYYHLTPEEFAGYQERFVKNFGVSIVGGCCGTTPDHLKAVVERVRGLSPAKKQIKHIPSCASLYHAVSYGQEPKPLLIGEQTNASGSRKFKQQLSSNEYESLVSVARNAVKEGAHLLDVNLACVGRSEVDDIKNVIARFNQHVTAPLMIDSLDPVAVEEALKRVAGKAIINSINLENGEERMGKICLLAKKYGASLVALAIDEKGMAKTVERKIEIAGRIHHLVTQKYGLKDEDLFFDMLTFTLGSGDEEYRNAALETLEAIRQIKQKFPAANTILGVSNISYGLEPLTRKIVNSVFLYEAVKAGLDAAIVHVEKILPVFKILPEDLKVALDLIYNRADGGKNPLHVIISHFKNHQASAGDDHAKRSPQSIEENLKQRILDGNSEALEGDLAEAMKTYKPLEIINRFLMEGMKVVGDLFGAGKMQLPFVLQSAEVMKRAVQYLQKFMDKKEGQAKGQIVLATVRGDVHDIGKNLVDIILTNNGYQVVNLGIKQPIDVILKAALEHEADAIGLSGLLVKSTLIMKEDLEELNRRGIKLPVICGGAALTRNFVEKDLRETYQGEVYYGQDAFSGLRIMEEISKSGTDHLKIIPAEKSESVSSSYGKVENKISPEKRAQILFREPVPKTPFLGYRLWQEIQFEEVIPWINKTALFRGQWQFQQGNMSDGEYLELLKGRVEPLFEQLTQKCIREKIFEPRAIYGFYPCYSKENNVIILDESVRCEKTRFHFPRQGHEPYLCIADYFRPKEKGEIDVIGFQVVTIGLSASEKTKWLFEHDQYTEYFYLHGLSVQATEALAEYVHARIRREMGIGDFDGKSIEEICHHRYQGCRYSFGYAVCPNIEDQKKLFDLIPAGIIGVELNEQFQLVPEQSTSAMIVHHPDAKYFSI